MDAVFLFALLVACGAVALLVWGTRTLGGRMSEDELLLRMWKDRARQRTCLDDARRNAGVAELAIKNVLDALSATEQHLLAESAKQAAGREADTPTYGAARTSLTEAREKVLVLRAYNQRVLEATALSPGGD